MIYETDNRQYDIDIKMIKARISLTVYKVYVFYFTFITNM